MKAGTASQRKKAAEHQAAAGISNLPNFSCAVSAQRFEARDSLDDFPTPPWGARAWAEHVATDERLADMTCWEPAANRGYLVRGLSDYFGTVVGSDIADYGAGFPIFDFLSLRRKDMLSAPPAFLTQKPDWIVTNPPFISLLDFALIGIANAKVGTAMFCRTQALEGHSRFERVFHPFARNYTWSQFVERISLVRGTVDPRAGRPAAYGWLTIWKEPRTPEFIVSHRHIPPTRKLCERFGDYPQGETDGGESQFALAAPGS